MAGRQSAASDGLELILNVRRADAGLESFERHAGRLWSLFLRSHHHTSSSRLLWKVFGIPLPLAHCRAKRISRLRHQHVDIARERSLEDALIEHLNNCEIQSWLPEVPMK
jgi:hypothetical protein